MRVILFTVFVSLATFAPVIMSTQAEMTAQSEQVPQTEAEYWLLLSASAKREYVHGYLSGFERGKRSACYLHAEKITPNLPHEAVPVEKLPEVVCQHSLPEFTERYYGVYVDTITRYYQKYPRDRQGGISQILQQMATPPGRMDIDGIHANVK